MTKHFAKRIFRYMIELKKIIKFLSPVYFKICCNYVVPDSLEVVLQIPTHVSAQLITLLLFSSLCAIYALFISKYLCHLFPQCLYNVKWAGIFWALNIVLNFDPFNLKKITLTFHITVYLLFKSQKIYIPVGFQSRDPPFCQFLWL